MRYYCGHIESFYFAYRYGAVPFEDSVATDVSDLSDAVTRMEDFNPRELIAAGVLAPRPHVPGCLCGEGPHAGKHHILVTRTVSRAPTSSVVRHRWNAPIAPGSFWKLSSRVYVSTPEFTYLQLAGLLTPLELALAGSALCSPYYLDADCNAHVREPLTTRERLRAYLDLCPGAYGIRKARRALTEVSDCAKSPLDLHLWAHFCFSNRLGGMGLPRAQVNTLVQPRHTEVRGVTGLTPLRANLYWRRQHAAIKVLEELTGPEAKHQLLALIEDGLGLISLSYRYLMGNRRLMDVSPGFFDHFSHRVTQRPANFAEHQATLVACLAGPDRYVL